MQLRSLKILLRLISSFKSLVISYRAAILYFVVQDLQKINNMYQFSLAWFKMVFVKSLELTNALRDDANKSGESDEEPPEQVT